MSPVKDFSLTYEAPNEEGTFSEGDVIQGSVTFSLTKDTKVKSLFVKAKGDGRVSWTDGSGDNTSTYSAQRRYFKIKEFLIAENAKGTVLNPGDHCFKFKLEIPHEDMPSSYKGAHGRNVYQIEAKMSKSWQWPSKAKTEICFQSKSFPLIDNIMSPQSESVTKEIGTFSKEQVEMSVTVDKRACSPGDTVTAVATICNSSSKSMKLKTIFHRRTVYRSNNHTRACEDRLVQLDGDAIVANSENTATIEVNIPEDVIYTLHNCDIVSVQYILKVGNYATEVYLDITFSFDPEVVFPLVIAPSSWVAAQASQAAEAPSNVGVPEVDEPAAMGSDAAEDTA